jgi:hypothetical protein
MNGYNGKAPKDVARVTCWCEQRVVLIDLKDVGVKTNSCGRKECRP